MCALFFALLALSLVLFVLSLTLFILFLALFALSLALLTQFPTHARSLFAGTVLAGTVFDIVVCCFSFVILHIHKLTGDYRKRALLV